MGDREVEYEKYIRCDLCGAFGAYDFMGDIICEECINKIKKEVAMENEFIKFDKIPRLNRNIIITEKIDGTNAQIYFTDDDQMLVGSRKRWITPEDDNFGFARWCTEHRDLLFSDLGYGRHYGEWWGQGIQRKYDLKEKRFSLFNVHRWDAETLSMCHVVPKIYEGPFDQKMINTLIEVMREKGSYAAKGFMKPEGIVIYHTQHGNLFKITLENDDIPKGVIKDGGV